MKTQTQVAISWNLLLFFVVLVSASNACDTWVALSDATEEATSILAKNSDRPLFDSQPLVLNPHGTWPEGSDLALGRITIPQVRETNATLGSSPYWCWGYEEGINEYGVAIGNEGVWTKVLAEEIAAYGQGEGTPVGPTGMDLVRLGLERGKTAHEALDVITGILQLYGQFGSGLPTEDLLGAYHNSFIIADPAEAWVLETAGTRWVAKKILSGSTSISNKLSIGAEWDLGSPDIVEYALGKGWWHDDSTHVFDFSRAYSDGTPDIKERDRRAAIRAGCSQDLLTERVGDITVSWMKRIARDRSTTPSIDLDQTASSCVAALPARQDGLPVFWWCPGPPSSSCYVPFFVHGAGLPPIVSEAGTYGSRVVPPRKALPDSFSESSYWWRFRDLCNLVNLDWKARNPVVRSAFDELEQAFDAQARIVMAEAAQLREAGKIDEAGKALGDFSAECTEQALLKTDELRSRFRSEPIEIKDEYASHVGTYIGSFGAFQDAEFQVLVRNGRLAVDIPGQMVVELKDADAEGLRYFTVTDAAAVSFAQDDSGKVTAMTIHQVITMPRKAEDPERVSQGAPDEYSPFVGAYTIPPGIAEMTVLVENDHLALNIPQRGTIELRQPDAKGRWFFADDDMTSVSFESDDAGKVNAMKLYQVFILPRK